MECNGNIYSCQVLKNMNIQASLTYKPIGKLFYKKSLILIHFSIPITDKLRYIF